MKEYRGYIMILGAAFFWGASATAAKFLLNQRVDTILIVQTRVLFSCLLMLTFYLLFNRGILRVRRSDLWRFALLGIIGVAGANFTYYFTIKESNVATGILIQYTAPLFVMGYAALTNEEDLTVIKFLAAFVSLFGCYLAVGAYDMTVLKLTPVGMVSGIGSVVCFAFLNIYTRHVLKLYNMWTVTFYSITFASVFWLMINPPWVVVSQSPSSATWFGLFLLAISSVLIPHTLYFGGLRYVVPSRAIITSTFEPVVAISSAAIILGELLEPMQTLGAVLVIVAIILLQLRRETRQPLDVKPDSLERTNVA